MDNTDTLTINGETTFFKSQRNEAEDFDISELFDDTSLDRLTIRGDYDPVNKPAHYNLSGGIECIDYIKQVLTLDGFIAYCQGNMIKYQHRHGYKGNPVQDMEKAQWYLDKMIEAMKEKHK